MDSTQPPKKGEEVREKPPPKTSEEIEQVRCLPVLFNLFCYLAETAFVFVCLGCLSMFPFRKVIRGAAMFELVGVMFLRHYQRIWPPHGSILLSFIIDCFIWNGTGAVGLS